MDLLLPWDANPKVGWWEDLDPIIFYHGTHENNLQSVLDNGLTRKDPDTGMISLALEPYTANAYAAMSGSGGEHKFRQIGASATTTKVDERVVIKFAIPNEWVKKHMDPKLGGNIGDAYKRMRSKDLYEQYEGSDQQYYQFAEIRVDAVVPPNFIVGYMKK